MRRFSKILLICAVCALLCALFALAAFAVPALPGTHTDGNALCRSHSGALVTLDSLEDSAGGRGAKAPVEPTTEKELPLLMIVLGFSNIDYADDYDWASTLFEGDKSLTTYYTDMSFGNFTFVPAEETSAFETDGNTNVFDAANDGIVHLKMEIPHEDWTLDYKSPLTEAEMNRSLNLALTQAILAAEPYVDFEAYDKNGDGAISTNELALGFVFAGYEASASSRYEKGRDYYLWAHAWSLEEELESLGEGYELPCPDGIQVASYIAISEQLDRKPGGQAPFCTLAHELGHYLGLPDLYNTEGTQGDWKKYDVSSLSLMSGGSWGFDEDGNYSPYSLDPWSRIMLGWCAPTEVTESGDFTVCSQSYDPQNETFSTLKIPTPRDGEYYLLENRQNTGWDIALCDEYYGQDLVNGIVLWHIDTDQYLLYEEENKVNNINHHPSIMPLFPEGEAGSYTFIGKNAKVDIFQPFFEKTQWETAFANLGETLQLPLYGAGTDADSRAARFLSDLGVTFLSDSDALMTVHVTVPEHVHQTVLIPRSIEDCTQGGTREHWLCSVCNRAFADEAAQTPLTSEELAIAPAEHVWNNGEVFVEPTYDDTGLVCYHCTVCPQVRYESLPQLERPEQPPTEAPQTEDDDLCPYCHQKHEGFLGFFVRIFHLILVFFGVS